MARQELFWERINPATIRPAIGRVVVDSYLQESWWARPDVMVVAAKGIARASSGLALLAYDNEGWRAADLPSWHNPFARPDVKPWLLFGVSINTRAVLAVAQKQQDAYMVGGEMQDRYLTVPTLASEVCTTKFFRIHYADTPLFDVRCA
jgi:hypothetical protein